MPLSRPGNAKLGDVVKYKKGYAFNSGDYLYSGVRVIRISDTTRNSIHDESPVYVAEDLAKGLEDYRLNEGDIILTTVGSRPHLLDSAVGKVVTVPEAASGGLLNQNLVRLDPIKKNLNKGYLHAVLDSKKFGYYISSLVRGNANQVSITLDDIFEYCFWLPSLSEQVKISQILSVWDKAITTTEQLLANSQQQKKALMQQLLTGKKRFAGFDGEWHRVKIEEIYSLKKGKGLSKDALKDGGNKKCILYGELYTKYPEVVREVISRTDVDDGVPSMTGDVLIPGSTTTSGIDLANATAVLESGILLGGDINILRQKAPINPIFMSHLITHIKKHDIAARAQGITIVHLYGSDIKGIMIELPPTTQEQDKIASMLTVWDEDINRIRKRLDCLKLEKKALMQQLLTGKRRVLVGKDG